MKYERVLVGEILGYWEGVLLHGLVLGDLFLGSRIFCLGLICITVVRYLFWR